MSAAPLSSEAGMSMLRTGIPLSLLIDLAYGPHSEEVLAMELSQLPTQRQSGA